GQGTIFKLYLPLIENELVQAQDKTADPLPGGVESILFVDDEEAIAQLSEEILLHLGYQVTSLTSSREALTLFQNQPKKFDLVITDQSMPYMSGLELAQKIMKIRPDIPVILCTGFSQQVSPEKAREAGIRLFLMKPLILQDLANAVRQTLDASPNEPTA
ncbi:MAG: response regulator, partial [Deltaproteobacteria bacterium]|nr:response regulator [Deltaproteobacteria bacterium]